MADLDTTQLEKALTALLKHIKIPKEDKKPKKLQLLSDPTESLLNEPIFFQLTTKKTLSNDTALPTLKPLTIPLPHSPYPATSTALLITKDPHDQFEAKLKQNPHIQTVLGLGALRKTYVSYEQLRRLRDGEIVGEEPVLVLADERVVPSLPQALGKAFYKTPRTTPIAIRIKPSTVSRVVDEAFGKSYVRKNAGNCVAIRIGFAGMSVLELVENCIAMWDRCVVQGKLVKDGVKGVRSGMVKSGSSVALPVYMTDELYSTAEDVLESGMAVETKKVKSKAERKLLKQKKAAAEEGDEEGGEKGVGKRGREEDDVETAFEEKRARKLARQEKKKSSSSVKA